MQWPSSLNQEIVQNSTPAHKAVHLGDQVGSPFIVKIICSSALEFKISCGTESEVWAQSLRPDIGENNAF